MKASLLMGLVLPVIAWFVLPPLGRFIVELSGSSFQTGTDGLSPVDLAWYLSFSPLLEVPKQTVTAALQGTRRMKSLAQLENGQEVVRVFAVALGALITFSPLGPIVGLMVGSTIGSIISLAVYTSARADGGYNLPTLRQIFAARGQAPLLKGLPLCLRIGVLRNIDSFCFNVFPQLVVRAFASPQWVTYFWASHRIMNAPLTLMQGVSRTALPAMSELRGLNDMEMFRRQWLRVTLISGGIISSGILIGLPLIPYFVRWAFPPDLSRAHSAPDQDSRRRFCSVRLLRRDRHLLYCHQSHPSPDHDRIVGSPGLYRRVDCPQHDRLNDRGRMGLHPRAAATAGRLRLYCDLLPKASR